MEGTSVEAEIRAEMDEVAARLCILPVEAFAERTALRDRQAQLRNLLSQFDESHKSAFPRPEPSDPKRV